MYRLLRQGAWGVRQMPVLRCYSVKPDAAELAFRRKVAEAEKQRSKQAPEWEKREQALRKRYGFWNPTRKISRQQMEDVRELKEQAPQLKTKQIADFFNMNPESIRRILRSKWVPTEQERASLEERAQKRKELSRQRKSKERELALAISGESGGESLAAASSKPPVNINLLMQGRGSRGAKTQGRGSRGAKTQGHGSRRATSQGHGSGTQRKRRRPYTQGIGDLID